MMEASRVSGRRLRATGASLVELLVCLGIMGVITAGMYSFFIATNQSYTDQAVVSRMVSNASDAMRRMANDIRRAGIAFPLTSACLSVLPVSPVITASNAASGRLTLNFLLDDPPSRTELLSDQAQTNSPIQVSVITGYQVNDLAFLTDGLKCTQFRITALDTTAPYGLRHAPGQDVNSTGAAGYTYLSATSMVYRLVVNQQITYAIDTSDPQESWLTRNAGTGAARLLPCIERLSFSYIKADGTTVADPTTIATPQDAANIRVVNITVTARADTKSTQIGGDGYRRQTFTTSVKLRNLGL